jgi:hypothetical protein
MDAAAMAIILFAVVIVTAVLVTRRAHRTGKGGVEPPPPEYEVAVRNRDDLKSGHLWGDLPTDPRFH